MDKFALRAVISWTLGGGFTIGFNWFNLLGFFLFPLISKKEMEASGRSGKIVSLGFFFLAQYGCKMWKFSSEDKIQPSIQSSCLMQNWQIALLWLVVIFLLNAGRVMNALLN